LLTDAGELIDILTLNSGLPGKIQSIGLTQNQQAVILVDGQTYASNDQFLSWQLVDTAQTIWSQPQTLPKALTTKLEASWQGDGLPLERVVLDIHSGRILGDSGVYIMDSAAILCLLLAASGVWIWLKQKLARQRRRRSAVRRQN